MFGGPPSPTAKPAIITYRRQPAVDASDAAGGTAALAGALGFLHRLCDPIQCAFVAAFHIEPQSAELLLHLHDAETLQAILPNDFGKIGTETFDQGIPARTAEKAIPKQRVSDRPGPVP